MGNAMIDIAIIGAGTAGSFAAQQLTAAGFSCCIVEKSRGRGGRCSRRSIFGGFNVDLGAASFPIPYNEHPALVDQINQWLDAGYLSEWLFEANDFNEQTETLKKVEVCGTPSMNAFHRHLTEGIECLTQKRINSLKRVDDYWQLLDQTGDLIVEAKHVVVTAPAEQAHDLLSPFDLVKEPHLATHGKPQYDPILHASQASLPQYMCAIAFEHPQPHLADVYTGNHPVFAKAIRANSKPAQPRPDDGHVAEVWILHSTYQWAQQQQHQDAESAAEAMRRQFCEDFNNL